MRFNLIRRRSTERYDRNQFGISLINGQNDDWSPLDDFRLDKAREIAENHGPWLGLEAKWHGAILHDCNFSCNILIMSEFLKRLRRKPTEPRTYVSYDDFMKLLDKVRPITVRLPISTVAKLDELQRQCPSVWGSRQELLFEMIESCVRDWIDAQPKPKDAGAIFDEVARKALRRSTDE